MTVENHIETIDRMLKQIDRLHSGPRVAQRLLAVTRDPDFEMRKVVECLEHDPALSLKVLRVVNSSRYGLAHNISSVRHAAAYLGRRSIRLIVLTFALVETLARGAKGSLYADYWRRTLTMAMVASRLARRHADIVEDDAYTAGLLADVGILVLAQLEAERYTPVYTAAEHGNELIASERELLGFGHPLLGASLLEHWELPETVVEAVEHHHSASTDPSPLEVAVRAGNLMADALWTPQSPHVPQLRQLMRNEFNLDLDGFIDLAIACQADIEESSRLFGVETAPTVGCEELLTQARGLYAEASLEAALELDSLESAIDDLTVHSEPSNRRPD